MRAEPDSSPGRWIEEISGGSEKGGGCLEGVGDCLFFLLFFGL
jgi:hypothetical protein